MGLLDKHSTEISALNALVQLTGSGGGSVGGATEATLSEINDKTPALGSAAAALSVPVVISTDEGAVQVDVGSVTIGSSALPTGASTSAMQTTQNNNLISIATNTSNTATNTSSSATSLQTIATNTTTIAVDADIPITGQGGQTTVGQNIILAVAGTASQSVVNNRSIAIQITPTGTISSGVVTFEGSNDNNTFTPILMYDAASGSANPVSSYTPATGITRFFVGPLHFNFIRARISTVIAGGGTLQAFTFLRKMTFQPSVYTVTQATAANFNTTSTITSTSLTPGTAAANLGKAEDAVAASGDTGIMSLGVRRDTLTSSSSGTGDYNELAVTQYGAQLMKSEEKHARTYSASAQVSPPTTARDVMFISGNATTVVYITKIIFSGLATTSRLQDVQIIRRTAANTGGTSSSMSVSQHDTIDAVPSSTPITYTVNPSAFGATGGTLRRAYAALGLATSSDDNILVFEFGDKGKPIVLRGVTQGIALNTEGTVTAAGDSFTISIEWYEI